MEIRDDATSAKTPAIHAVRPARGIVQFWIGLGVASIFIVTIGADLFGGGMRMVRSMRTEADSEKRASYNNGSIRRTLLDGTFCQYTTFDNNFVRAAEDKVERCELDASTVRERKQTQFNWGK